MLACRVGLEHEFGHESHKIRWRSLAVKNQCCTPTLLSNIVASLTIPSGYEGPLRKQQPLSR